MLKIEGSAEMLVTLQSMLCKIPQALNLQPQYVYLQVTLVFNSSASSSCGVQ
jgi:hypothetical protein